MNKEVSGLFNFLRKRNTIVYCHKSDILYAWQVRRENFKDNIPEFILKNRNIELWCGDTIGGQLRYDPHQAPNTSDKEQIIPIPEGTWLVQYRNGTVDIVSDGLFRQLYYKVICK